MQCEASAPNLSLSLTVWLWTELDRAQCGGCSSLGPNAADKVRGVLAGRTTRIDLRAIHLLVRRCKDDKTTGLLPLRDKYVSYHLHLPNHGGHFICRRGLGDWWMVYTLTAYLRYNAFVDVGQ